MQSEEMVAVTDGEALHVGDGNWMTFQTDEHGKVHSTLMNIEDMRRLIDATP